MGRKEENRKHGKYKKQESHRKDGKAAARFPSLAVTAFLAAGLSAAAAAPAWAGVWKQYDAGWKWEESDGSGPVNAWKWIDGNGDGIAECYCFDQNGILYTDTVTPDRYQVNADGAWVQDGLVVTKQVQTAKRWSGDRVVAHALGQIDGQNYTNSLEAFKRAYGKGLRTFEADFSVTSDGALVCWHGWENAVNDTYEAGTVLSLEEFRNARIKGHYTTLTIEDLLGFMKTYEDVWIVTDTKDTDLTAIQKEFGLILEAARKTGAEEVLDRLIVQLYHYDMYQAVEEVRHFPNYVLTLYQLGGYDADTFAKHCRFCKSNGIRYIAMWADQVAPKHILLAQQNGIEIYVHTVNDSTVAKNLTDMGVAGIYSDVLTEEDLAAEQQM